VLRCLAKSSPLRGRWLPAGLGTEEFLAGDLKDGSLTRTHIGGSQSIASSILSRWRKTNGNVNPNPVDLTKLLHQCLNR
jgi:hypothetical protein